jgi:hypothetical protein
MNNYPDKKSIEQILKAHYSGIFSVPNELHAILTTFQSSWRLEEQKRKQYQEQYNQLLQDANLWINVWRWYLGLNMKKYPWKSEYVYLINTDFFEEDSWCPARQMYFGTYQELLRRFHFVFKNNIPWDIKEQLQLLKQQKNWFCVAILCTAKVDSEWNIGNIGIYDFIIAADFIEMIDDTLPRISCSRESPEKAHAMLLAMNPEATDIATILELSWDHIVKQKELSEISNDNFMLTHAFVHENPLYHLLMGYGERKWNVTIQNNIWKKINNNAHRVAYLKENRKWSIDRLHYIINERPEDAFYLNFQNPLTRTVNSVFTYYLMSQEWFEAFEELRDCFNAYLPYEMPDDMIGREELDFCIHGTIEKSWTEIRVIFDFIGSKVNEHRNEYEMYCSVEKFYELLENRCDTNHDLEKAMVWESNHSNIIWEDEFDEYDEEDDEEDEMLY